MQALGTTGLPVPEGHWPVVGVAEARPLGSAARSQP